MTIQLICSCRHLTEAPHQMLASAELVQHPVKPRPPKRIGTVAMTVASASWASSPSTLPEAVPLCPSYPHRGVQHTTLTAWGPTSSNNGDTLDQHMKEGFAMRTGDREPKRSPSTSAPLSRCGLRSTSGRTQRCQLVFQELDA